MCGEWGKRPLSRQTVPPYGHGAFVGCHRSALGVGYRVQTGVT